MNTMHNYLKIIHRRALWLGLGWLLMAFACGGGSGSSPNADNDPGTGSIALSITWKDAPTVDSADMSKALDCAATQVSTVSAAVYNASNGKLADGGPWNCTAHKGTISNITPTSNCKVVVLAKDAAGHILYRGEKSGISVASGKTASATVVAAAFSTTITSPADKAYVALAACQWNAVAGAASYEIKRSANQDMSGAVSETATATSHTFTGLTAGSTYYIQVAVKDAQGNTGIGSKVSSFSTLGVASLLSPSDQGEIASCDDLLAWSAITGAASYELLVSTQPDMSQATTFASTQSSYSPYPLTDGTTYYWQVFARDSGQNKASGSDIGQFTVKNTVLLKDIFPGTGNSSPNSMVLLNGTMFFSANDGIHGVELWKSDGTAAGTQMVKDIRPDKESSSPQYLTVVGSLIYFTADDGSHGRELWASDGTTAVMLKDLYPGTSTYGSPNSGYPLNLTDVNGTLYFSAADSNGRELWKSDGTAGGTVMIMDIYTGTDTYGYANSGYPSYLTNVNGTLYFSANNGVNGTELWRSNGTVAGTYMIGDIYTGVSTSGYPNSSSPYYLTNVNGILFFIANDGVNGTELWRSNGTASGTYMVSDIYPGTSTSGYPNSAYPAYLTNINGILYFSANDGVNGNELWRSNGSDSGTVMVSDIYPGTSTTGYPNSSSPYNLTNINGTLYFRANDGTHGNELWRSSGNAVTTQMVKDINPGSSSSFPMSFVLTTDTIYFLADDGSHGFEVWKSDGSDPGTTLVKDAWPGSRPTMDEMPGFALAAIGDSVLFQGNDGQNGFELWISDGTATGTKMVKDINAAASGTAPGGLVNAGGRLFFSDSDGSKSGQELWTSDGSAPGTVMLKDINPAGDSAPAYLTNVNGTLFFFANDGSPGLDLWTSDGTAAGTKMVKEISTGSLYISSSAIAAVNDKLFFSGPSGLWVSDGTATGTKLVRNLGYLNYFCEVNGILYFQSDGDGTGAGNPRLWRSDGTASGTYEVVDTSAGTGGGSDNNLYNLTKVGNRLFFTSSSNLWVSNGTPLGTSPLTGIQAQNVADINGTLFFAGHSGDNDWELWKSSGTLAGTARVRDIETSAASYPSNLTNVDGKCFFTATNTEAGNELWVSDGTLAGTHIVKDIVAGSQSSYPYSLTAVDGFLFFVVNDQVNGAELWVSDGTEGGTVMVEDINAGEDSSSPSQLTDVNGTLFFTAVDKVHARELWKHCP